MLIDAHCHLNEFRNIAETITRAKKENVGKIFSCAVDAKSILAHIEMQEKFPELEIALGLHPSNSVFYTTPSEIKHTISLAKENIDKALAVGEIGLDFKHADTEEKRKLQRKVFSQQLGIAEENKKPVVVHSRRSHLECFEILEGFSLPSVLMHWFYDSKFLKQIVDAGFYASIGPSVFSDSMVQEFALKLPLENLLLETDGPVRFNGKPAEPAWIKKVAEKVAELKEISLEEIEKVCEKNFSEFSGR